MEEEGSIESEEVELIKNVFDLNDRTKDINFELNIYDNIQMYLW